MCRTSASIRALVLVSVVASGAAFAGDLNPPAGPIAPTPGPEPRTPINLTNTPGDADSLFKISVPGSYYLTGNVVGVGAKHGIEIASSGVTIDLMGFEVLGVPGSLSGVAVSLASATSLEVSNGSVRSWGGDGIDMISAGASNIRLEALRVQSNAGMGIILASGACILNCTAQGNGATGIRAEQSSTIIGCASMLNGAHGFSCGGDSNTYVSCTATQNGDTGFLLGNRSTVSGCTATTNTWYGIVVSSDSLITGNLCAGSYSGVRVNGSDNRIEGNNCLDNSFGFVVDSTGNFVARNTCSGNTSNNFEVVPGNVILVVNATLAGAISGNSGGAAPGSTDPNANYSY